MAPPGQNREFPIFKITRKRTMSQENDHDFRDQHKILVLEMLTNPCGEIVTRILLHSVISVEAKRWPWPLDFVRGSLDLGVWWPDWPLGFFGVKQLKPKILWFTKVKRLPDMPDMPRFAPFE